VANYSDNNVNFNINSKLYKWNGTNFVEFQAVPTTGIYDWEYFSIEDEPYLAAANYYDGASFNLDSKIYKVRELLVGYGSTPTAGNTLNLGSTSVGNTTTVTLTVKETGSYTLAVSVPISGLLIGANANDFNVIDGPPFEIVDGGANRVVTIECTPSTVGLRTAILTFATNDPDQPIVTYPLSCSGLVPPSELPLTAEAGYTNIELSWSPINDPHVTSYRLSRTVEGDDDFAPIAMLNETIYFDSDPSLVVGTSYCYQVEALRADNSVRATSPVACAIFGQVDLWIPETWAAPGQVVIVPVNIRNATGLQIAASEIWLDFDETVIEPLEVLATPLSANYSWGFNLSDNRIRISAVASPPPTLQGDGSLFWLVVHVLGTSGDETLLDLREFVQDVGGSTIYAPDDLFNPIPLQLQDGVLHVANGYGLGDLNGNGVVEAVDAYLALQIASHKLTPTQQQRYAGDVNGNGRIDAADATMILYYAIHHEWPSLSIGSSSLRAAIAAPVRLSLGNVNGEPGTVVTTTLKAENLSNWAGGEFVIAYDPTLVESIVNVSVTGLAQNFSIQFHDDGAGLLYIALADDTPVSGSGALLTISLALAPGAVDGQNAPLALAEAQLNDDVGRDFATSALQQPIERQNGQLQIGAIQPGVVYIPIIFKLN
jgi:hypothetical protein